MQPGTIEPLDFGTRTRIRSTQILTSLPQIVSELLQNSLDAGPCHIEIGINCEEWSCWVRDDGCGISKDGLAALGKEAEEGRYSTSKAYSPDSLDSLSTFGFRGEALSSAADLCCLEISSRTRRSRESWSIILRGSKHLYTGPSIRWRRESPGTVVSIRDAFYNLPVRRLSHPSPTKTLELIRAEIEAYALVFPHVSFCFENTANVRDGKFGKEHILRVPKTESSLAAFRRLYGKALVEHVEDVLIASGDMRIEGFISLDGAHSKAYQFLYINRHPLSTCDLHRAIDIRFAASTYAKHAYDENGETTSRSSVRRSPRKVERKPVYLLNIIIPPREVDNCLEPAKSAVQLQNRDAVCSFLTSVVQSFLVRHGFVQEASDRGRTRSEGSPSPRKRRRHSRDQYERRIVSLGALAGGIDKLRVEGDPKAVSALYVRDEEDDDGEEVTWTDPTSGQTFLVDRRTGNSYLRDSVADKDGAPVLEPRRTLSDPRWFRKGDERGSQEKLAMPHWIQQALQANQAYPLAESRIPAVEPSASLTSNEPHASSLAHDHGCHEHVGRASGTANADLTDPRRRFRKIDLLNAQVIAQVDRKFIACLINDNGLGLDGNANDGIPGRALVLIDQHAADERIRVERFLQELCIGFLHGVPNSAKIKQLSPAVPVLLARHEVSRLSKSKDVRDMFERWGIRFAHLPQELADVDEFEGTDASDVGYAQVMVSSIPAVVSDKLLIGNELRELVKGFLASMDLDNAAFNASAALQPDPDLDTQDRDKFDWLRALRYCPRELLDLVNSKACRGAIMFNDSLTVEQCRRLVTQLSETAFPFQCAHGRPSLVPLVRIEGQYVDDSYGRRKSKIDWDQFVHPLS